MRIEANNILIPLNHNIQEVLELASKKVGIKKSEITNYTITRRSVDARRNNIRFNYCLVLDANDRCKPNSNGKILSDILHKQLVIGNENLMHRPVIIGAGPAGLFSAYFLAQNGYKPIVFERGGTVNERTNSIENFIKTNILDTESNIQFGEGGAGTFSDGKLTTRIDDERCQSVLEIFVKHGAPSDILFLAKPHIGTDKLREIIVNMRNEIIRLGGEFHFNKKLQDITITPKNNISATIINGEEIPCEVTILAIGHSARDTYELLNKKLVAMTSKAFAIGVRIEHLQSFINDSQYGDFANHSMLGMAEYRLAYNGSDRSCFSFCMCPGGSVVAATSEEHGVVVNGMSNYARDGVNANSALVVNVNPSDYDGVLGGIEFQRKYERMANKFGNYSAPVQTTADFLNDTKSTCLKGVTPTYPNGYEFCRLDDCLPDYVSKTLRDGIGYFNNKIKNFSDNSVLTGVETRTSAPVRILRDEHLESINVKGLYPIGEGAGYAGGIMSAAVDGIKVAEKIIEKYSPNNL